MHSQNILCGRANLKAWLAVATVLFSFLVACSAIASAQSNSSALTVNDVISMLKAELPEAVILSRIKISNTPFNLSTDDLVRLKQAGASEKVLLQMLEPNAGAASIPATSSHETVTTSPAIEQQSNVPNEVGVYFRQGDKLVLIEPEPISLRTSGFPMFGRNFNGTLANVSSPTRLVVPAEVVLYCSDGTVATDYQLLRLDVKKDHREFRAMRAGLFGTTKAGGEGNTISVEFRKLGPRLYGATLDKLAPGEYGWLPPGSADLTKLQGGSARIHSFRVPD